MIIGLSGKLGTGKNYIAEKILPSILRKRISGARCYFLSFADQMKVELCIRNPGQLNYKNTFVEKTSKTRQILQKYGTEECRSKDPDIWIRAMDLWIQIFKHRCYNDEISDEYPIFIISDVRFGNEADWIVSNNGLLIRVDAPQRNQIRIKSEGLKSEHSSETSLDEYPFDYFVNNDVDIDLERLVQDVESIFNDFVSNTK